MIPKCNKVSFLFRKRIIDVVLNHLLFTICSKSCNASSMRFCVSSSKSTWATPSTELDRHTRVLPQVRRADLAESAPGRTLRGRRRRRLHSRCRKHESICVARFVGPRRQTTLNARVWMPCEHVFRHTVVSWCLAGAREVHVFDDEVGLDNASRSNA